MSSRAAAFLFTLVLTTFVPVDSPAAQDREKESSPLIVSAQFSTLLSADCNSGKGMIA